MGRCHVLVVVNSAVMNVRVPVSLPDLYFSSLDEYSEVGLLDLIVVLFLICLRNLFSILAAPCYISSNVQGFQFLHIIEDYMCSLLGF